MEERGASSFVLFTLIFRVVNELDAPAQSDSVTWTPNVPIVKTCVGDARTNACPVTAPSASNTSFSERQKRFCQVGSAERAQAFSQAPPLPLPQNLREKAASFDEACE